MTHRLRLGALLVLVVVVVGACGTAATPTSTAPERTQAPTATRAATAETITASPPGDDWRSKGAASAPVVIVEYSDFQ